MLCTASLAWRRITLLAITVVSTQGTVFCITVIFQCRLVTLLTVLIFPSTSDFGIKTAPRLLESEQRATAQLHQSSVLSAHGRHHQYSDWFCRRPPSNSNNLVTPNAHPPSTRHNYALQLRVCILWCRNTSHLLHVQSHSNLGSDMAFVSSVDDKCYRAIRWSSKCLFRFKRSQKKMSKLMINW